MTVYSLISVLCRLRSLIKIHLSVIKGNNCWVCTIRAFGADFRLMQAGRLKLNIRGDVKMLQNFNMRYLYRAAFITITASLFLLAGPVKV